MFMKKLLSLLSIVALLTYSPCRQSCALETTTLKDIAISLGADTDYLGVKNYVHNDVTDINNECYVDFLHNATNIEAWRYPATTFHDSLLGGRCLGISILEILSHNGIIFPSDIHHGAENLCDIALTPEVDKYITDYQALQAHNEFDIYQHYLASTLSTSAQCDRLIELAEKNMIDKDYFLITYQSEKIGHAVVGIGIANGNWNYNDISYDKCILTLDSNASDTNGNPVGFSEDMCIYINSTTKQIHIPYYNISSGYETTIVSIDDETLLNYKGTIKPSNSIDTDLSLLKKFELNQSYKTDYHMTVTNADGIQYDGIEANLNRFGNFTTSYYFVNGSTVCIESIPQDGISSKAYGMIITEPNNLILVDLENPTELIIEDNDYSIINKDSIKMRYDFSIKMNEGAYKFSPHYSWDFSGTLTEDFNLKLKENGILISGTDGVKTIITVNDVLFDEAGYLVSVEDNTNSFSIIAQESVLISFAQNGMPILMIDNDNNGIYDYAVPKGDVNCDGLIDASDASLVLSAYVAIQSGSEHYVNEDLSDYNSDGNIDASDASLILRYYSDIQTGN